MGPTSILVFALSAALGFAIFHYVWEPEHPTKYEQWFEKPRITYICIGIGLVLLASVVVYSLDIHSSIGTHFWFLLVLINSPIGYSLVLGLLFGLLFGYWSFMIMSPEKLATESSRMVHNRWGYVLGLIIFIAIVGPGLKGFLERVTEIRSAPLQLSLAQPIQDKRPDASVVQGANRGQKKQASALALSDYYTSFAIPYIKKNIATDNDYIFILTGKDFTKESIQSLVSFNENDYFIDCISLIIQDTDDPQILHDLYGAFLHDLRKGQRNRIGRRIHSIIYSGTSIANKAVLILENIYKIRDYLINEFYSNIRQFPCNREIDEWSINDKKYVISNLYDELLVSFALGSAGANESAIRALADWINSQKEDADYTAAWAIIRAMQYLQLSLSQEGMDTARLELLKTLLGRMEAAFDGAPYNISGRFLADRDRWTNPTICRDLYKEYGKTQDWKKNREIFNDTIVDRNLFKNKEKYHQQPFPTPLALLAVSYISFSYLYVESAYISNDISLNVIQQAQRNTKIQECLFRLGVPQPSQAYDLQAKHHELYARLLLRANEYWKEKLFVVGVPANSANREALRHLIIAQSYMERAGIRADLGDANSWYDTIQKGEDDDKTRRRRVDALVRNLSLALND
jgi:hypothetical protein